MASVEMLVKPAKLYRYRSLAADIDRELRALREAYLWCSAFRDMNDPMEGLYEAGDSLSGHPRYNDIVRIIRSNKESIGICSLSENPQHELMWAHYADQFRGVCIEYDLKRLVSGLASDIVITRVHYDEKIPAISLNASSTTDLAKQVLSCKNYRWLYEREWRILGPLGRAGYRDPACVSKVYIGGRMRPETRRQLKAQLDVLGIAAETMTIDGYTMVFEPA